MNLSRVSNPAKTWNLEKLNTILSGTNHIWALNSASGSLKGILILWLYLFLTINRGRRQWKAKTTWKNLGIKFLAEYFCLCANCKENKHLSPNLKFSNSYIYLLPYVVEMFYFKPRTLWNQLLMVYKSGCKDIGIRKLEFVACVHLLFQD